MVDRIKVKTGAGRKPIVSGMLQSSRRVNLDDRTVDILRHYGAGNLSAGVRKAADLIASLLERIDK